MDGYFLFVFQLCFFLVVSDCALSEVIQSSSSGRRIKRNSGPEARIIGGMDAPQGKYPFMAFLLGDATSSSPIKCGATILNDDSILTAGHCVVRPGEQVYNQTFAVEILVGYVDWKQGVKQKALYEVKSVHMHPVYRGGYPFFGFDLAVLKLEKKMAFSDKVAKVCLPQPHDQPDPSRCVALGWGRTVSDEMNSSSMKLQEASLPILPQHECGQACNAMFAGANITRYDLSINKAIICGGQSLSGGSTGICYGDSGGPLMCPLAASSDPRFYQFGISSFVIGSKCNNAPGFFTNVRHYIDWIQKHAES